MAGRFRRRVLDQAAAAAARRVWRDDLLGVLARGALLAFVFQAAGILLRSTTQILFARTMGAEQFGVYAYLFAWLGLLGAVGSLGLPATLLRFVPEYELSEDWERLRGIVRFSWLGALLGGAAAAVLGSGLLLSGARPEGVTVGAVATGMLAVPLLAILNTQTELARSLRRMALSYASLHVVRGTITIVAAVTILAVTRSFDARAGLMATAVGLVLTILVQARGLRRVLPFANRAVAARSATRAWLRVAFPLLLVDLFIVALEPGGIIVVGLVRGAASAGIYTAALRIALLVSVILTASSAIAAPMLARLYFAGDHDELQRLVRIVARASFGSALVIAIAFAFLADPLLGLFGSEFTAGSWALRFLLLGQLVHASTGPVVYLLTSTGHQDDAALAQGATAAVHIVLTVALARVWGIEGAAIATAVSTIFWNAWLFWRVRQQLGIHAFIW